MSPVHTGGMLGVGRALLSCALMVPALALAAPDDAPPAPSAPAAAAPTPSVAPAPATPATQTSKTRKTSQKPRSPYRWYALPNIAYDTDDGLGFGARGELAVDGGGLEPYKMAFVLHGFATLRGYHHHRFRFDRLGLGPGGRVRLTLHLAWRQWDNDGYWGIGNGAARERAFVEDFGGDDPRRKRYRYTLFQPFAHLTLRGTVTRRVAIFAAANLKYSRVETYPGSLLLEQRPFGMDGGLTLVLSGGVIYDSREPEVNPRRGLFAELSGRVAGPLPHGAGTFGGVFASLRAYHAFCSWFTLAGRAMVEVLLGEIPFYEMVHWGGSVPVAGFGGFETLRGISFGRFRAPGKAIVNLEGRFRVLAHTVFGRPIFWQVALFSDVGTVFGAGDRATAPEDRDVLHPAWGAGLRAVFQEAFVGRVDVGLGIDPIQDPDGTVARAVSWGIYVVFDHAF